MQDSAIQHSLLGNIHPTML